MIKIFTEIFSKIKLIVKEYAGMLSLSIGIGGFLSLYIIRYCRIKLLPIVNETEIYKAINDANISSVTDMESKIFIISLIAIMLAPILIFKNFKIGIGIFLGILSLLSEHLIFCIMIMSKDITTLFLGWTIFTSIYLVFLSIYILKCIFRGKSTN